jgi:uncharacterized protein (DUF1800 family)
MLEETSLSRRRMLGLLGATAAGATAASAGQLALAEPAEAAATPAALLGSDQVLHLVRRTTYGPTPALVAEVRKLGTAKWLEQQLAPARISDPVSDKALASYKRLNWSIAQAHTLSSGTWDLMFELSQANVVRAAWSKRQLFEVMVDFWSNHLNVTCPSSEVWDSRHLYDSQVVRRHALGRFEDMLLASATHPSMLRYLNNDSSTAKSPNENYGRELLELHTVGVTAGYTETDIRNSALILTGQSIDWRTGTYVYTPSWHHVGPVRVLGFRHANATAAGGTEVARAYLRYLASHPATAKRIATKLCLRFVSDAPPKALVDKLAKAYLVNKTAIAPVLRALFSSREFKASIGQKTRRPYEDMIATIRTLGIGPGIKPSGWQSLYWMSESMGQPPLGWHPPNGYPDVAAAWGGPGEIIARIQNRTSLVNKWWPSELAHPGYRSWLPAKLPTTWGAVVDALAARLLYAKLTPAHRAAVLVLLQKKAADKVDWKWAEWPICGYLVPILLHSPYHTSR